MKKAIIITALILSSCTNNTEPRNLGGSTSNNASEMVLDKKDLMVGKSAGSDVSRSAVAVTRYRTGQPISNGAAE